MGHHYPWGNFTAAVLLFSAALCFLCSVTSAKWCTNMKPVQRSHIVWRDGGKRAVTRQNWFGFRWTEWQPYKYTEREDYYAYEWVKECCDGYTLRDEDCQPTCDKGCPSNSHCTFPDICECNGGYASVGTHVPVLFCAPVCSQACPLHSSCVRPEQCACDPGYGGSDCQPICQHSCLLNANCAAPDLCECNEGYQMLSNGTECTPICMPSCPEHGECVRPLRCQCSEGYAMQKISPSEDVCTPVCNDDCTMHAKCVSPGVCECLPGYAAQGSNSSQQLCQAVCSRGCQHGLCFSPEICVCSPGYLMGPNNTCKAVCTMGCLHGQCVEPEICRCDDGYGLQQGSVHTCEPICDPACEQGDCVAPNVCICRDGYKPADGFTAKCASACATNCSKGHCETMSGCKCSNRSTCVPACENCSNGDCLEPGVCQCWPGYDLLDRDSRSVKQCMPITSQRPYTSRISNSTIDTMTTSSSTANSVRHEFSTESSGRPDAEDNAVIICLMQCDCWLPLNVHSPALQCARMCGDDENDNDDSDRICIRDVLQCHCNAGDSHFVCDTNTTAYMCHASISTKRFLLRQLERWWVPFTIAIVTLLAIPLAFICIYKRLDSRSVTDYTIEYRQNATDIYAK